MFERLDKRAILSYEVATRSDLHIGGHSTIEPAEVDNPVIKNIDGYPIIPGSSLKGILRTEMERLLRGVDVDVCDVLGKARGGCNICPVCKLFGGKDLSSSIRVKDATANQKKTLIRDGVAIDRKKRKAKQGGKYDTEVVPKGTVFEGSFTIENLNLGHDGIYSNAKLGALLSLVDFFNSCSGSIGHATSRGFGEVELKITGISLITAHDYLEGNYKGKEYASDTSEYDKLRDDAILNWSSYIKSGEYE